MQSLHLVAIAGRSVVPMSKQQNQPVLGHHPSTAAEIRQVQRDLMVRALELQNEGAKNYQALQAGTAPSRPISDHERRVTAHIQKLMNGSTPSHLLVPAVSRDDQIRAELDAIAFVSRDLARQEELTRYSEAETWVAENDKPWRALCREIVLCATRLASLEERARKMLEPIEGVWVAMPMGATIGSGLSLLGIGDPLLDMRTAALKERIVTDGEIRKAQND
jgi:hypothetical protein